MFVDKLKGTPVSADQGSIFVATNRSRLVWLLDENTDVGDTFSIGFHVGGETETIVQATSDTDPTSIRGASRPSTLEEITDLAIKATQERPADPLTLMLLEHVSGRILAAAEAIGMSVVGKSVAPQSNSAVT